MLIDRLFEEHFESNSSVIDGEWVLDLTPEEAMDASYSRGHDISKTFIDVHTKADDVHYQTVKRESSVFNYEVTHTVIYDQTAEKEQWYSVGSSTLVEDSYTKLKAYTEEEEYTHFVPGSLVLVTGKVGTYDFTESKSHFSSKFSYDEDAKENPWVLESGDGYIHDKQGKGVDYSGKNTDICTTLFLVGTEIDSRQITVIVTESGSIEDSTGEKSDYKVKNGKWANTGIVATADYVSQSKFHYESTQPYGGTLEGELKRVDDTEARFETHLEASSDDGEVLTGWGKDYSYEKSTDDYFAKDDAAVRHDFTGTYSEWYNDSYTKTSVEKFKYDNDIDDWKTTSGSITINGSHKEGNSFESTESFGWRVGTLVAVVGLQGLSTWDKFESTTDLVWTYKDDDWNQTKNKYTSTMESGYSTFYAVGGGYSLAGFTGLYALGESTRYVFKVTTDGHFTEDSLVSSERITETKTHRSLGAYSLTSGLFFTKGMIGTSYKRGYYNEGYSLEKEYRLAEGQTDVWEVRGTANTYASGSSTNGYDVSGIYVDVVYKNDLIEYDPFSYQNETIYIIGTQKEKYEKTYAYDQTANWEIGTTASETTDWILVANGKKDSGVRVSGGTSSCTTTVTSAKHGEGTKNISSSIEWEVIDVESFRGVGEFSSCLTVEENTFSSSTDFYQTDSQVQGHSWITVASGYSTRYNKESAIVKEEAGVTSEQFGCPINIYEYYSCYGTEDNLLDTTAVALEVDLFHYRDIYSETDYRIDWRKDPTTGALTWQSTENENRSGSETLDYRYYYDAMGYWYGYDYNQEKFVPAGTDKETMDSSYHETCDFYIQSTWHGQNDQSSWLSVEACWLDASGKDWTHLITDEYGQFGHKNEWYSTSTYDLSSTSITPASGWDIYNLCSYDCEKYVDDVETPDSDTYDYTDREYDYFGFYSYTPGYIYTEISIPSTPAVSQTYGSFALEELPENISGKWDHGEGSVLGWSLAASVLGGSGSLLGNKLGLADIIPTQPGEIYQNIESKAVDQLMAHDPNLLHNAADDLVQEDDSDWSFTLFGQVWVMPWSSSASGFGETAYAYGEAIGMTFGSIIYGAAGGAATGTATGLIVGAIIGGSAGGVGALPGAAAGAVAGLVGGTVWGGLNGLWNAIWKDPDVEDIVVYGESAEEGMVIGVYAGILGPVFNKIAERLAATDLLPVPKTPKPVSVKPSASKPSSGASKPPGWNESWTTEPPSGEANGSWRHWDPQGGEWRWHAPDKWHSEGHWDYNPWTEWNSSWQNIPHNKPGSI